MGNTHHHLSDHNNNNSNNKDSCHSNPRVTITNHNVDTLLPSGETMLIAAIQGCDRDGIVEVLRGGADVNRCNKRGNSPLHEAIFKRKEDIAEILLQHAADPSVMNKYGVTPFHIACLTNQRNVVVQLLDRGIDVDCRDSSAMNPGLYPPLVEVAANNNAELVELLLKSGADPNTEGCWGATTLMKAVQSQNVQSVYLLLSNGVKIDNMDAFGGSALHYALLAHNCDICSMLIDAGCDVNVYQAAATQTRLVAYVPLVAAIHRGCMDCFTKLISSGADINKADNSGKTPLTYALSDKQWKCNTDHESGRPASCSYLDVYTRRMDNTRWKLALKLLDLGADSYPALDQCLSAIENVKYMTPECFKPLHLCIKSTGCIMSGNTELKAVNFFRALALVNQTETMELFYSAGYQPSKEDVTLALNAQKKVDSVANGDEKHSVEKMCSEPRTLSNICAIQIRRSMGMKGNVYHKVKKTGLPRRLQDIVTLDDM